ncbi:hypothetical protein MRX96_056967 [Rhipicephalus microplus]
MRIVTAMKILIPTTLTASRKTRSAISTGLQMGLAVLSGCRRPIVEIKESRRTILAAKTEDRLEDWPPGVVNLRFHLPFLPVDGSHSNHQASKGSYLALARQMCLNINQPYCDSNKPAPEDLLKMHQFEVLLNEGREEAALSVAALMAGNEELLQKAREICAVVAPHGGLVARLRQLSSSADVYTPRHEAPIVDPAAFQKAEALLQGVWDLPSRNALQPCSAIEWRDQLLAVQIEEVPDAPIMEVPDVPGEEAPDVRVQPPRADISELDPSRENPDTDASRKMRNRRRRRHRRRRYRRNKVCDFLHTKE